MRRKRIEVKIEELVQISENCCFSIDTIPDEERYRLIEWEILEDAGKRVHNIYECDEKYILQLCDEKYNLLIKIVK